MPGRTRAHPIPAPVHVPTAPAEESPLLAFGNSMLADLLGAIDGGKSGAPQVQSAPFVREREGRTPSADHGALTVGRSDPERGGWFGRFKGADGNAQIQAGRTKVEPGAPKDGSRTTTSGGFRGGEDGWAFDWTKRRSPHGYVQDGQYQPGIDTDGEVAQGKESTTRIGPNGIEHARRTSDEGKKTDVAGRIGFDGTFGGKAGWEDEKGRGAGMSFSMGDGRQDVGFELKPRDNWAVGVDVHRIDKTTVGRSTNAELERGREIAHTTGGGIGGSIGYDTAPGGFGANVSTSNRSRVAIQQSDEKLARDFDRASLPFALRHLGWAELQQNEYALDLYLRERYGGRLDGVSGVGDADLVGMGVGEGFTFQEDDESAWGVNGRVHAVSIGFGSKDQARKRTSVARTEDGWKVRVETNNGDEKKGNVGLFGVLGAAASHAEEEGHSVELDIAEGPEGEAALRKLQRTGLLPGADKLADPMDPDRYMVDALGNAVALLEERNAPAFQIAAVREQLFAASGRLNARVLGKGGERMLAQEQAGFAYRRHTERNSEADMASISVLGLELLDFGTTEAWWDQSYRQDGRTETERGYQRDDDYVFADDERTSVRVNPEGAKVGGDEVELAFSSLQDTTKGQRQLLDRVGAKGMDPAMRAEWANGTVNDGSQTRVGVSLTRKQLDVVRDRMGPTTDDFSHLADDARKGLSDFGLQPFGGTETTRAMGGPGGYAKARDLVGKVTDAASFDRLKPDEKKLYLVAAAQGAQYADEWKAGSGREEAQPWRVLPLALRIEDPKERDEAVRTLFRAIEESSRDSTCAVTQLVDFLDRDGHLAGLSPAERGALLQNVAAAMNDGRVNDHAKVLGAKVETDKAGAAKDAANGLLGERERDLNMTDSRWKSGNGNIVDRVAANRGDAMLDWLQAAERAGGPELVAATIAEARKKDPKVVATLLSNTASEKYRQITATNLLTRAGVRP